MGSLGIHLILEVEQLIHMGIQVIYLLMEPVEFKQLERELSCMFDEWWGEGGGAMVDEDASVDE